MPSDGYESIATKEDNCVERQLKDEEDGWSIGILYELFSCAVTEKESCDTTEPQEEGNNTALENLVEPSHFY